MIARSSIKRQLRAIEPRLPPRSTRRALKVLHATGSIRRISSSMFDISSLNFFFSFSIFFFFDGCYIGAINKRVGSLSITSS